MKNIFVIFFTAAFLPAYPQFLQTPCVATAQGQAGNYTISYTIGEMPLVSTFANGYVIISNGVLQPHMGTAVIANVFLPGEIKLYPNPAPGKIILEAALLYPGVLSWQIHDVAGKLLLAEKINYNAIFTKPISLANYAAATYFFKLQFTAANGTVKTTVYKIVKTSL